MTKFKAQLLKDTVLEESNGDGIEYLDSTPQVMDGKERIEQHLFRFQGKFYILEVSGSGDFEFGEGHWDHWDWMPDEEIECEEITEIEVAFRQLEFDAFKVMYEHMDEALREELFG